MSAAAVSAVSAALKKALDTALGGDVVDLKDPTLAGDETVSVWLYQVSVDEFNRNAPAGTAETVGGRTVRFRLPPLPVNLHYLVTPKSADPATAQNRLAEVLLALHANPILPVDVPAAEVGETVRISLMADQWDEKVKLWEALARPYRLSACFNVRTVRLVPPAVSGDAPIGSVKVTGSELPPPRRAGD